MSSTEILARSQLEDPSSSVGLYELPCGYLDPQGVLHTEIELREITGEEEDMLGSRQIPDEKKYGLLIGRCLTRVGTITDKGQLRAVAEDLTIGDRTYLLFAVRRVTLGNNYPFRSRCPECEKESTYNIDLSTLEIQKMKDPKKRVYDVTLPRSGKLVRFRILTGRDEGAMAGTENIDAQVTLSMLKRIEMFDGKPPTLGDIQKLGMMDRNYLRQKFDEVDGGVDTTMEITCAKPRCSKEYEMELHPGQSGFFSPPSQT